MDQQTLRQWENHCIQEEQPFCQAACPLHVDGRAFIGQLARGDADGARKTIERALPLPGVLGRICEAPCEAACKRRDVGAAGEPLAIGKLERFAIAHGRPGPKPLRLPGKNSEALVLGRGLSALVCAWDLLKKGYAVTLRTLGAPLGAELCGLPSTLLPQDALPGELATLRILGLTLDEHPGAALDILNQALVSGRAVYLEQGWSPETDAVLPPRAAVDALTLAEGRPGLFVGGWPAANGALRFIDAAADGRRAASSLDRHLSGASLTASREREGVCETRLFTNVEGVAPAPRVTPVLEDYDADEARREAERCLNCQCLECVRVCDYLAKHKAYPKVYARQIYNNAAIVRGQRMANKLINSCSLCGLCERVCPEHFNMAELCLTARRDMVARKAMPPSAHEFALEEMTAANGPECALARLDPKPQASGRVDYVFFPGCQLAASHPHHVESAYAFLREHLSGGVGLMLGCCGVPAHWAGEEGLFRETVAAFVDKWAALGRPRIIAACSSCLSVFRQPAFREAAPGLAAVSLWRELNRLPLPGLGLLPQASLAVHDPCTARDDPDFREAVRSLLTRLGVSFKELPNSGELAECCGFGGLMAQVDRPLATQVAERRASESRRDYVAACAMCRDRLFAVGKRCLHLLDLIFPCPGDDPAGQPGPGYSGRQEARAALKTHLLHTLWGETVPHAGTTFNLLISSEVEAQLEERRILIQDVRRTIGEALTTGRCLRDAASGHLLASLRPRRVTFWAEYMPEGDGYRLLRAYSHRMIVPGAGGAGSQDEGDQQTANPVMRVDQTYLPEGGDWRCASCNEPLEPKPVVISYLDGVFTVSLLTCPACGLPLVPEALALGRMFEVEQLLEDK
ncbi:MAG: [Fe-S]-binding protein [Desulfovibrionaceae bacterium CG1_02_65_16]|nr:MAG: [Fe-S]-binding protein [Desulfovibrionaceae bacterium CG1_02_65_16]